MPLPGRSPRWAISQASRCSGEVRRRTPSRSESRARPPRRVSTSWPPAPSCSTTSVTTRALAVAVVARTGRAVGQRGQQVADAAVVGAEVVAPVADAVRLVDDEQPAATGQGGQLLVAEARVVEPLGADEQHVDLVGGEGRADLAPLLGVGRVHRHGPDAGALGRGDLVAHQGEQGRDDDRRPGPLGAAQRGGDEVDRGLAPPGALDDEHPLARAHERLDRLELALAEVGVVAADEAPQHACGAPQRGSGLVVADMATTVCRRGDIPDQCAPRAVDKPVPRPAGRRCEDVPMSDERGQRYSADVPLRWSDMDAYGARQQRAVPPAARGRPGHRVPGVVRPGPARCSTRASSWPGTRSSTSPRWGSGTRPIAVEMWATRIGRRRRSTSPTRCATPPRWGTRCTPGPRRRWSLYDFSERQAAPPGRGRARGPRSGTRVSRCRSAGVADDGACASPTHETLADLRTLRRPRQAGRRRRCDPAAGARSHARGLRRGAARARA